MVAPVAGFAVSTPYGRRGKHWSCRRDNVGNGIHTGIDYACPSNTPLVAAVAGTIRHRNYGSAFGDKQFAISPSKGQPFAEGEIFYAHGNERLADGTEVQVGQVVGKSGARGNVTGPHLHFEYHPNAKNVWSCAVVADPQPVIAHRAVVTPPPVTTPTPPSSNGPYVTKDVYSNKMGFGEPSNGDDSSDSVKELQERLNRIKLVGGQTLPVTGFYGEMTDGEVRLWQEQVALDSPDPVQQSYLGPKQFALMFPSSIYTRHDVGLPAVATGTGGSGGGGTPPATTPPAAPPLAYPLAIWNPVPKASGGYFMGLRSFVGAAKKVTVHTTETSAKPNWASQQSGIPHFTIDLKADQCWQHLPLDMAAYTLKGGEKSPNSDSGLNIQIEIVGFAAQSGDWGAVEYVRLETLLSWICENCDVPWDFPRMFGPKGSFNRLTWETWYPLSGIVGHQHVPYNDHWDPGALNTDELDDLHLPPAVPVQPPVIEPPPPVDGTEPPVRTGVLRKLVEEYGGTAVIVAILLLIVVLILWGV